jgi:hypothetical protein
MHASPAIRRFLALLLLAAIGLGPQLARACPFCSAVSVTFGEEMKGASAAVVAHLKALPAAAPAAEPGQPPVITDSKAKFEIVTVLKGQDLIGDKKEIEVTYFGQDELGKPFLIMGVDSPEVVWNVPVALTDAAVDYVAKLPGLPESGPDRLAFFLQFLENSEEMLARDAYDEFAKAPYAEVKALRERMDHDKLVSFINKPEVPPSRRGLYLTMLGVCGGKDDLPMLEAIIKSDNRDAKSALNAVIACYLTLAGADGLPLIEDQFLKNAKSEYTDTYAAIMAIRFHGQEESAIPKERLVEALEYMLDRPELADLVIPDLARWEDWKATDRLVALFKNANEDTSWVRVPVVNFLKASPLPEAKTHLEELAKIDPEAVKRASSAFPFAGSVPTPVPPPDGAGDSTNDSQPVEAAPAANEQLADTATSETPSESEAPAAAVAMDEAEEDPAAASPVAVADTDTADPAAPGDDHGEPKLAQSADEVEAARVSAAASDPLVDPPRFASTPRWLVVIVPLAAGVLLLGIFLVVLRGGRREPNA